MSDYPGWAAPDGSASRGAEPDRPAAPAAPAPPPPPLTSGWGQPAPPAWGQSGPPAWGGWTGTPAAPRPGVIPLRPLGVGELLDGAITTIRRYPRATLGLSAVVVSVTQLIGFFATRSFTASLATDGFTGVGTAGLVLSLVFGLVSGTLLTGALTVIMGQAVLGRPISLAEAWLAVRSRAWALVGTSVLVALLTLLSVVACIVPFFYAWPALSLATPALMLERQTVWKAIQRSRALVKGQIWRCLGVVALAFLIKSIVEGALSAPFVLAGGGFGGLLDGTQDPAGDISTGSLVWSTVGAIIAGTVVAPFSAGVSALLYVDRRMRAEGLDVTLAAAAATSAAGPVDSGLGPASPPD